MPSYIFGIRDIVDTCMEAQKGYPYRYWGNSLYTMPAQAHPNMQKVELHAEVPIVLQSIGML